MIGYPLYCRLATYPGVLIWRRGEKERLVHTVVCMRLISNQAIQALNSAGITSTDDEVALGELRKRHPISQLLPPCLCAPPALVVDSD